MSLATIFAILLTFTFTENYALIEGLGTGAVIENERSKRRSLIIGAGTIIVMLLTTLITWPLNKYVLKNVTYLQTMVFVIVVMLVVYVVHLLAKKRVEGYCHVDFMKFGVNGAVLGLCIHNTHIATLTEALVTSFAVGFGMTVTMIVFSSLYRKVDHKALPKAFRGTPINLLIAGLIALALLAF